MNPPPKTTSVLVGLGLVLVITLGDAQGRPVVNHTLTNTFINNTGQAVGGLHIQYGNTGSFFLYQTPYTFTSGGEDGSGGVSLNSRSVEDGGGLPNFIIYPPNTPKGEISV